ncbi:hypothetical protein E3E29_04505 [Thermococcus sp. Bubb.Bath]|nr:hypothetical protein [Thermococcus sp. Bubb.Bath]
MEGIRTAVLELLSKFSTEEGEDGRFPLQLTGVMVAHGNRAGYNFSLFDVTEDEILLSVQMGSVIVYLGFEGEEELDEEEYPELVEALLRAVMPEVRALASAVEKSSLKGPEILYDRMSTEMREFVYDIIMRHLEGKSVYDQVEAA